MNFNLLDRIWVIDANDLDLEDLKNYKYEDTLLVKTSEIERYLEPKKEKFAVIVSPKGLGKTYLLKIKSQQIRATSKDTYFIPAKNLCERIEPISIEENIIHLLQKVHTWSDLWVLSIYICIYQNLQIALPGDLGKIIKKQMQLSDILQTLIINISKLAKYTQYINSHFNPTIPDISQYSDYKDVTLFIDNVDEGFDGLLQDPDASLESLYSIWLYSQIGIVEAIEKITKNKTNLRIYTTIREEAYHRYDSAKKLQIQGHTYTLKYSAERLREMLLKKIDKLPDECLVYPDYRKTNPIKAFLGFEEIPHSYKRDHQKKLVKEKVFDFILRHTFGRPREIMAMGLRIAKTEKDRRKEQGLSKVVNEVSEGLFNQLVHEAVPKLKQEILDEFFKSISHNILRYEHAREIEEKLKEKFHLPGSILRQYYHHGILGIVKDTGFQNGNSNGKVQFFLPQGHSFANDPLPETEFLIIHPASYKHIEHLKSNNYFYDRSHIAGNDQPFNSVSHEQQKKAHVHMGLTRDCITIVIPELYHDKCLGIWIDSNNNSWQDISRHNHFILNVHDASNAPDINLDQSGGQGAEPFQFRIYRDNLTEDEKRTVLKEWKDNNNPTLFFTRERSVIDDLHNQASTFSFCEYDSNQGFFDLLELKESDRSKIYYYCKKSFDQSSLETLSGVLYKKGIALEKVLIDRLYYRHGLKTEGRSLCCNVISEDYNGRMVCPVMEHSSLKPSNVVIKTNDSIFFNVYEQKFRYLREGLFQFFKFLSAKGELNVKTDKSLFDVFIAIQIGRFMSAVNTDTLHAVFEGAAKHQIERNLGNICAEIVGRYREYQPIFAVGIHRNFNLKEKIAQGVFFNKQEFFKIVGNTSFFKDYNYQQTILRLIKLFEFGHLEQYKSVFISYTGADAVFADLVSNRLKLRGVKTFMFEAEKLMDRFQKIMNEKVSEYDITFFIASEDSISSEPCLFELRRTIEKRKLLDQNNLFSIRLDNKVIKLTKYDIEFGNEQQKENVWNIIDEIQRRNSENFHFAKGLQKEGITDEVINKTDEVIDRFVSNYLLKKSEI